MKVKSESEVAQSCPTPSDPMDCSLTGSSPHGTFQERVLEWGAIAFSGTYVCIYIYTHTNIIFFIHSSVDGHLGCFHVLAVVNSAVVSRGVHVSFQIIVLSGYMPRGCIAGSYGNSIFSKVSNFYKYIEDTQ